MGEQASATITGRERIGILLAEGQTEARLALREYLKAQPGLDVVGEAADCHELVAQTEAIRPDLVLLDWDLPGQSKGNPVASLRNPDCQPLVVVLGKRLESSALAMDAGADAFVYKGQGPRQVALTIRWLALETRYA
jgi:DNA-binding NarL/FixJ family response regulator